ncbi:PDPK1 kinase, partial [Polypterus senegalus]
MNGKKCQSSACHIDACSYYYSLKVPPNLMPTLSDGYAKNGELLKYIRKIGSFDETCTRFYSAEIVCALEYLHKKGIIHRNEYLIFQKIIKLEYEFPEKFFPKAKDLVQQLLSLDPTKRLGCEEMGGYKPLRAHPFFESITWENLHLQTPPKLTPYLPAMSEDDEDCYGNYDDLLSQFGSMQVTQSSSVTEFTQSQRSSSNIEQYIHDLDNNSFELDLQFSDEEKQLLLEKQAGRNQWHQFVENNLILKMGPVDKRKPNRTYYLMDPSGNADRWCKKIQEVWRKNYHRHQNAGI